MCVYNVYIGHVEEGDGKEKLPKSVFENFCQDRIVKWKGYKSLQWDWTHARFHLQVGRERNR